MRRLGFTLVLTAATATAAAAPGQPAGAVPTFTRSPASGPGGTQIALSGTECPAGKPVAAAALFDPADNLVAETPDFPVGGDGSWSGTLIVPAASSAGQYEVDAGCFASDQDPDPFLYDPLPFTVTGPGAGGGPTTTTPGGLLGDLLGRLLGGNRTTTTTTPTTTTTVAPAPPVAAAAPPARPVATAPSFTG